MLTKLTNGEKRDFLDKLKLAVKLLFSPEIYEELADEFQAQADAKRQAKQAEREANAPIPGNTHAAET